MYSRSLPLAHFQHVHLVRFPGHCWQSSLYFWDHLTPLLPCAPVLLNSFAKAILCAQLTFPVCRFTRHTPFWHDFLLHNQCACSLAGTRVHYSLRLAATMIIICLVLKIAAYWVGISIDILWHHILWVYVNTLERFCHCTGDCVKSVAVC